MSQISAKFWTATGCISLLLSAWSVFLATIDGVMAYFVIFIAMIVGGFSSIGETATTKYAVATALVGVVLVFWMSHYVVSTGVRLPSVDSLTTAFAMISIPLLVSGGMLILGIGRRRKLLKGSAN